MRKTYEQLVTLIHPIAWILAFEAKEQRISHHCHDRLILLLHLKMVTILLSQMPR